MKLKNIKIPSWAIVFALLFSLFVGLPTQKAEASNLETAKLMFELIKKDKQIDTDKELLFVYYKSLKKNDPKRVLMKRFVDIDLPKTHKDYNKLPQRVHEVALRSDAEYNKQVQGHLKDLAKITGKLQLSQLETLVGKLTPKPKKK